MLKVLSNASAKATIYTAAALGIAATIPDIPLPPELAVVAGGLGIEAMGSILDKIAFDDGLTDDEIVSLVENSLAQLNIEQFLTKDEFWHGFSHLRRFQSKTSEQNVTILSKLEQIENQLSELNNVKGTINQSDIVFVDVNSLNDDHDVEDFEGVRYMLPKFTLQEIYDRTSTTTQEFPIVFDLKLVNQGQTVSFLKEIHVHVIAAQIDPRPVVSYYPTTTKSGNNLALCLENYGWGPVNVEKFVPFVEDVEQFNVDRSNLVWSGTFDHNIFFIFPNNLIARDRSRILSKNEVEHTEDTMKFRLLSPSSGIPLWGPMLAEDQSSTRDEYLNENKGLSYERFKGRLEHNVLGETREKELWWGHHKPGAYTDLLFSEKGFHLIRMGGMAAYVPPSHNYNLSLAYKDRESTKRLKISHEVQPNSVERFTITTKSAESCIYSFIFDVVFDDDRVATYQKPIVANFLSFRKNDGMSGNTYIFDQEWLRIE